MVVAVAPVPGHTVVPLVAVDCILPEEGDSTMAAFELCRVSVVAAGLVTGHVGRARQPQVALFADVGVCTLALSRVFFFFPRCRR